MCSPGGQDVIGCQNNVDGLPQVFDEPIRRLRGAAITTPVAGLDADRGDSHSTRRDHITATVSNTIRAGQRDIPVLDRLLEHPGFRLATRTIDFQFRNFAYKPFVWMVRTEI